MAPARDPGAPGWAEPICTWAQPTTPGERRALPSATAGALAAQEFAPPRRANARNGRGRGIGDRGAPRGTALAGFPFGRRFFGLRTAKLRDCAPGWGGQGPIPDRGAGGNIFFIFFQFPRSRARPCTPHSRPPPPTKSANPRCATTGDRPPQERAPGRKRENSRSLNEQPPPGRRPFATPPGATCPALARQGISRAI